MANSPFINSVYINLKHDTVLHECFGNIISENAVSTSNKFSSRSFLFLYLNDNVFAVRLTKERSSEDKRVGEKYSL